MEGERSCCIIDGSGNWLAKDHFPQLVPFSQACNGSLLPYAKKWGMEVGKSPLHLADIKIDEGKVLLAMGLD